MADSNASAADISTGKTLVDESQSLLERLFPICRSLTGDGVRRTLAILREVADFDVKEIASGKPVYDWIVPDEWNIHGGYLETTSGRRIVDFDDNNLHVVNYSIPVDKVLSFAELESHLHTLPDLPEAIPYRTTYYDRQWGFCLTHRQFMQLDRQADYHVCIDATLKPGRLTYGEVMLEGETGTEYLISTYCCHPSLANDNLSGMVLWALMLRELQRRDRRRNTYRFIIVPETIGAIAYLNLHEAEMKRIAGGFIPTTVAGPGPFGFKHTFLGDHLIDRVVAQTFSEIGLDYVSYPFDVNGSDEAHYSAPYFRIPIGTISKDKYYEYDYYHTSLDNLDFIRADNLVESLKLYLSAIDKLELNRTYRSLYPYSEPMLGKRGLYPRTGGTIKQRAVDLNKGHLERAYTISGKSVIYGNELDAIRWLMFYGDGEHSLLDIAEATALPMRQLHETAEMLCGHGLMQLDSSPEDRGE
jgi:aminopeptidase-like protein